MNHKIGTEIIKTMKNKILDSKSSDIKPGIYEDLSFEEYLQIKAISNTYLGQLKRSPRHAKSTIIDDKQKHFVVGSLIHCGRLEPAAFDQRYAVLPDFHLDEENVTTSGERSYSKSTKYTKQKTEEFQADNTGKEIVSGSWYREAKSAVESLYQDEESNELFNEKGNFELTLVWNDVDTGLLCKARMDKCGQGRFVDLKSCKSLESFPRSLAVFGYHRQMAHYQEGYSVLNGEVLTPWIVAVEKESPFCVQSAPLCEEALQAGIRERERLIKLHLECERTNNWPGPESPTKWRVAEWALDDGEELELIVNGQKVSL